MVSPQVVSKILSLRSEGITYREISRTTGIAPSTAWRISRHIAINSTRTVAAKYLTVPNIFPLSDRELHIAGLMLYWAEGSKSDLVFTNTDTSMLRLFLLFLRNTYQIHNDRISISVRSFGDRGDSELRNFWRSSLNLPESHPIAIYRITGKKTGKHPFGICRIRIKKSSLLLRSFFAIIEQARHRPL